MLKRPPSRNSSKEGSIKEEGNRSPLCFENELSSASVIPHVTQQEADPTFHERDVLGCTHYRRNCKKFAACCHAWYTCRFCHDEVNDHQFDR